jgi:hypothetical protein
MALKPCRECKKEVSTGAKTCPHCGVVNPTSRAGAGSILGLLVAIGLLIWFFSPTTSTPSSSANSPAQHGAAENDPAALCRADWRKCGSNAEMANTWGGWSHVKSRCKNAATSSARFGEPKWPWFAFGSFYTGSSYLSGKATVIESDAQFQNGFGANQHVQVVCSYDLNLDTVTDVSVTPHS